MCKKRRAKPLIAVLLALGTLIVFLPVVGFEFTNFDDTSYVTENPVVRAGLTARGVAWAFSNLQSGNWHPLTWLSHMLDVQWYGLHPGDHHLTSVLFHAATTVLLFLLLRSMTGALWRSAAVAALFALHPLHVESVAWIAERKDVLSGFFGMLSLWAYASYARLRRSAAGPGQWPRAVTGWYVLAFLTFACGLMSKPMLVTWPFVLLLLDYWPLNRFEKAGAGFQLAHCRPLLLEKLPFFCLSLAASAVALVAQRSAGAVAPLDQVPLTGRVADAAVAYVNYLAKLILPIHLAVLYPQTHWPAWQVIGSVLLLTVLSALAWWQRHARPFLWVGWLWFLGTLVPVIGLVQIGNQAMADRYMYLPSIGLFLIVAWGAAEWARAYPGVRRPLTAAAVLVLCLCAVGTRAQLAYWRNSGTLFRRAVAVTPNNPVAWNGLGFYYADSGDLAKAQSCFESALAVNPQSAYAWSGLAKVALGREHLAEAINDSEQALKRDPKIADAQSTLGQALAKQDRLAEALPHYVAAAVLRPDSATAQYNLANALARAGQLDSACAHYRQAIALDPKSPSTHSNLGYVLVRTGQFEPAVLEFEAALTLDPTFWLARFGLGDALARLGRNDEAVAQLAQLLHEKPDFAPARQRLAQIRGTSGR